MREILFRGKRVDNGEWIKGYLYRISEKANPFIMLPDCKGESYEVDSKTVGQYTGLTDSNSKKIFKGDIVKCSDENNDIHFEAVVEFGNPNGVYDWGYQLKRIIGDNANTDILLWVDMEECGAFIEVIGNVYDNPELLKEGVINDR